MSTEDTIAVETQKALFFFYLPRICPKTRIKKRYLKLFKKMRAAF